MASQERDDLRRTHYNARIVRIRRVHDELMVMRAALDAARSPVHAGQYTVLGLGAWEPRIDGVLSNCLTEGAAPVLVQRAYSISCPILDEQGNLATIDALPFLEFYLNRICKMSDDPPMLTPRLSL